MLYFSRPTLAERMADLLVGADPFENATNGLFLAAPRRTGKTAFLQADLRPVLERRKILPVYMDLWTDNKIDPSVLLRGAVSAALLEHQGPVAKAARRAGVKSATVGAGGSNLTIDPTRVGEPDGPTLLDALRHLHMLVDRPVALLVDEAQELLKNDTGDSTLRALKAARDTLNIPGKPIALMLLFTGSDRDKLSRLTNTRQSAFYDSQVRDMPMLGRDFVAWVAGEIVKTHPHVGVIDNDGLLEAFERFGRRPKKYLEAIGKALNPLEDLQGDFLGRLMQAGDRQRAEDRDAYRRRFLALGDTQRAVLTEIMEQGEGYAPTTASSMQAYATRLRKPITPSAVTKALDALRDHNPSLIWKSNRGDYAVEDQGMAAWYRELRDSGGWPPSAGLPH